MKIGIDAKWLFRGPPSGRRVVLSLVDSLLAQSCGDELHLFLDAASRGETLPAHAEPSQCHYVWAGNNQLSNLFLVARAADRVGVDAVVYQNFAPPPAGVRHARIAFVHDVIFHSHPQFFNWRERVYFTPLRYLSRRADRVCTVSASERARMARYDFACEADIDVVPNAVDATFMPRENFPPRSIAAALDEFGIREPFVLYVGRLTARKNVETLVRAMSLVQTKGLTLVVVGAADDTAPDLATIAMRSGLRESVKLLGPLHVGDPRLRALYAAAAIFCFPSLEESFGLPPLEAMASGTPVITSDVAAIVEVCGDAAIYVDVVEPRAIARAIDALMSDPARREQLRGQGLSRARQFTWQRSAARLRDTVAAAVSTRS